MEELVTLPGVGRKTANIVLNKAFGVVDGIAVDTHVYRIASRLKLVSAPTPAQAEPQLLKVLPRELWGPVNEQWIHFGREVCTSQRPKCDTCRLVDICPSAFKANGKPNARKPRRTDANKRKDR
jgi:endonuclease-3